MSRPYFILSVLCFSLLLTAGCGLLESRKKPNVEESPPYYQSYRDEQRKGMTQQVHVFRNRELEKLEQAQSEEESEQAEEQKTAVVEKKDKKKWFPFGIDSKSFFRSEEAARISSNLDR